MTKRLIFNGFSMNAVSHVYHGLWRHPLTAQTRFNELETWVELAKLLEKGKFDALFVADILGVDAVYKGSWDTYVREAVQIPINDSGVLAGALIQSTEHLGLTLTSSILQEHPFNFARKLSTLDHLSKGRVGWNIVTSVSHNAAQNFGFDRIVPHDERYRWAEEYVDVVYKLWEGSWDEDAVVNDKAGNLYADPAKIHRIHHHGQRYKVLGPHLSQPSRQRTPVLFQAGSSRAGRAFAARHAEGTFIAAVNPHGARRQIEETRALVRASGRDAGDLLFIQGMSFVVGGSEEEAQRKARDLAQDISVDGLLAHISRDLGIDLGLLDPDRPVDELEIEGVQGIIRAFEEGNPGKRATVADLGRAYALSSQVIGTPETIADQLFEWQEAGIDGINLIYHTTPGSFVDFIENVTPILQKRGLAQSEYAEGSFRERLFAEGTARLPDRHPASRYRGAFTGISERNQPAA
ncbi:LLM class flavin-dependent oxidoreductase [Labrys sp. KNU-23]|uniref:LLM class flavin-dependent oxidoreductase n=1 Tax=unclassified Labrys (in: a-proteobacteria) TaxID=2688601 RepID=UPI0011EEBBA5|nr:LLM class flavin-dependent oxidoreductase [Labrys sp. KNU-23]QEN84887.1 LLM class flavin-dependent oxidoreductase [Labrys sp. KNU-23]